MDPKQAENFERIHRHYDYDDLLSWRRLANAFKIAERLRYDFLFFLILFINHVRFSDSFPG
jgi:hypothetical protein